MSGPFPAREGVMLANPVTGPKLARLGKQFFSQPKLNGERCRIEWFQNKPFLISSYGNEFNCVPHLNAAIEKASDFYGVQVKWDGEAYTHGMPRETCHSIISRRVNPHPDAEQLQFHIFDHQCDQTPQYQRLLNCREFCATQFQPLLNYVEAAPCAPAQWIEHMGVYTDQNYEGIILRDCMALYEEKRSLYLLKYKPTERDEYQILEVNEAVAIDKVTLLGMVGSFWVSGDDGTPFKVGAGKLSHLKRKELWKRRTTIPGKQLLVKHEKIKTINSIPVSCIAVEVKE